VVVKSLIGEAATTLIISFLTRPDMQELYMGEFIAWATLRLSSKLTEDFGVRIGAFRTLAALFKHAKREEILQYGKRVLQNVTISSFHTEDTVTRKLGTKLIQRIGQIFLKTRVSSIPS